MKKLLYKTKPITTATLSIALLFAAGCSTNYEMVGTFAFIAEPAATMGSESYDVMNRITIEQQISNAALANETITTSFGENLIGEKDLKLRKDALQGVAGYAKALNALATSDFKTSIDQASAELFTALGGLQETYKTATQTNQNLISKENMAIIATAVSSIANIVADSVRKDELRKIIINSDPAIQNTMDLVKGDVDIMESYVVSASRSIYGHQVNVYSQKSGNLSYDERMVELSKLVNAKQRINDTKKTFESLSKLATKIAEAHAALKVAAEKDEFDDPRLVDQLVSLADSAAAYKKYYDELLNDE